MDCRDSKMDVDQDESEKQDQSILPAKDISNDHKEGKIADDALENKGQLASADGGASEDPVTSKEQVDCTAEERKDESVVSDSLCSEKNELEQSVVSNESLPTDKSKPKKSLSKNPVGKSTEARESVMNVDVVPNSLPSEMNQSEPQDVDMTSSLDQNKPSHPVTSKSGAQNGKSAGLFFSDNCATHSLAHAHVYTHKECNGVFKGFIMSRFCCLPKMINVFLICR